MALEVQQHLVGVDAAEVKVLVEEMLEHRAARVLVLCCAHAREQELHVALDLHLGVRAVEPLELLQLADIVHVVGDALLRPADVDGRVGIAQRALDRAAHRAGFDQLPGLEVPQLVVDLADVLGQVKRTPCARSLRLSTTSRSHAVMSTLTMALPSTMTACVSGCTAPSMSS